MTVMTRRFCPDLPTDPVLLQQAAELSARYIGIPISSRSPSEVAVCIIAVLIVIRVNMPV